jgi:hypothetical protein
VIHWFGSDSSKSLTVVPQWYAGTRLDEVLPASIGTVGIKGPQNALATLEKSSEISDPNNVRARMTMTPTKTMIKPYSSRL